MRKLAIAASLILLVAGLAPKWLRAPAHDGLRLATYNIERFGEKDTDLEKLRTILAGVDADVVAVQEIVEPGRFERVVEGIAAPGRVYRWVGSACGGRSRMHVGFVYDAKRVAFEAAREYPELEPGGDGRCSDGGRPGLLGRFRFDGGAFELLVVHLHPGGTGDDFRRRQDQWERALAIVAARRKAGTRAIGIVGDTNSAGFLDGGGERRFIERRVAEAGMRLYTGGLACSEYFYRKQSERYVPSLLDHLVATPELKLHGAAQVHGYCVQAGCQPLQAPPREYVEVSDHCPVSVR